MALGIIQSSSLSPSHLIHTMILWGMRATIGKPTLQKNKLRHTEHSNLPAITELLGWDQGYWIPTAPFQAFCSCSVDELAVDVHTHPSPSYMTAPPNTKKMFEIMWGCLGFHNNSCWPRVVRTKDSSWTFCA